MKKIIAVVLSVCMLLSFSVTSFATCGLKKDAQLQFNEDGKFKMLVLADVQDGYPMKEDEITFINEVLDATEPDVVIFDGDNIVCNDVRAYDQLFAPLTERGIPFTFVFGNHDDESTDLNKEEILAVYQQYEGCLAYDADPDLHGCATHNLPVLSSDGEKVAFNLWLMDSGDYVFDEDGNERGYDWVREDQIEWYQNTRDALQEENDGELVPSMMFQHIIPKEACEKLYVGSFVPLGDLTMNFDDGSSLTFIPDISTFDGYIFERSCPGVGSDGQWQALVDGGDVLGVVVGHDHVNNFVADIDGVDLIQTAGCTYNSYSSALIQGGRVIEIDEENPWEYETYNVTTAELAQNDGSDLPGGEKSGFAYTFDYYFDKIFSKFFAVIQIIAADILQGVYGVTDNR